MKEWAESTPYLRVWFGRVRGPPEPGISALQFGPSTGCRWLLTPHRRCTLASFRLLHLHDLRMRWLGAWPHAYLCSYRRPRLEAGQEHLANAARTQNTRSANSSSSDLHRRHRVILCPWPVSSRLPLSHMSARGGRNGQWSRAENLFPAWHVIPCHPSRPQLSSHP